MALHPPLQRKLNEALKDIFDKGYFTDQVLENYFKSNRKWGSRDRKAFAQTLYGIVRWIRPLVLSAGLKWKESWAPKNEFIAQFTGLKNLNEAEWTEVYKVWLKYNESIEQLGFASFAEGFENQHSLTDFCLGLLASEIPSELEPELVALNKTAPVYIRCNSLKTNPKSLKETLEKEDIFVETVQNLTCGLKLLERKAIFQTKAFQQGLFEMQDGGSQLIAEFLKIEPGQKIVDACAGAGGKSLHLSALSKNKGRIIALDIFSRKLEELERRARRAGAFNIETRVIESTKVVKRLESYADRLLLDVPCSGSGVFRRNPDSKWRLSPFERANLLADQQKILSQYSKMLKAGGKMVYSTCSMLKSENSDQVESFLNSEAGRNFELEEQYQVLPSKTDFDGFYMARLHLKS